MVFHGKAGVRKAFYLKPSHLADFTAHLQDTILQRVLQVQRGCTGGPKKVPKNKKKKEEAKNGKGWHIHWRGIFTRPHRNSI